MYICLEMQDKIIKVLFLLQIVILGAKVPPQTCQQSIFRILIATQITPRGKRVALLNMNKRPGLPRYNFAISRHTGTVSVRRAVIFYMLKLSTVSRRIEPFASRCEYSQTV